MKIPYIPNRMFKYGIKPGKASTEQKYNPAKGQGVHLAGFDVETVGTSLFKHNDLYSVQIVMNSKENSHIFFPKEQCVKNLDLFFDIIPQGVKSSRVFATAHNASFDFGALLGKDVFELMKGNKVGEWKGKVVDGTCSFAILRNKAEKKTVTIADSMAWYKTSLKKVAEQYFEKKMQKLARPEFLGKKAPDNKKEFKEFVAYAEQDAQIQLLLTEKIYELCMEGKVKLCLSPAQLAGRVFQKQYLSDRLFLPYWKRLDFIARTYHGAAFTAFGRGFFRNIYYYDINSLYPFAAINVPLNFSNTKLEKIGLESFEHGFVGFAAVRFAFPEKENYPCLPVLKIINNFPKLCFPSSGFSYCSSEELLLALKKNCEIKGMIGWGWWPDQADINHPLANYMIDIYTKKAELDKLKEKEGLTAEQRNKREYYKLLLNSLIGKFCQRNRDWLTGCEVAGTLFRPDFGSLILGKSRAIINSLLGKHNAIYSDTDCLITKKALPTGTRIGELKNELGKNRKGDLLSIRSKLYFVTADNKLIKCAKHGFRLNSQVAFDYILKEQKKTFVPYSVTRLTKLKEAYKRNRLPRREVNQSFKIMMRDDGKRDYFKQLSTVNDLLTDSTLSSPLAE